MGRGKDSKLRRRQNRADARKGEDDPFGENQAGTTEEEQQDLPLPPKMKEKIKVETVSEDSDDDDDDDSDDSDAPTGGTAAGGAKSSVDDDLPLRSKKKQQKQKKEKLYGRKVPPSAGSGGGIKTGPLILLIILFGTTVLPAIIYASDYIGKFMSKNNVMGSIGFRLGIGQVPKKRVLSFYEKHSPEKLDEVPQILSKYYGDYPTLIKRLERKYQDYGYFIGWQEDEAPMAYVQDTIQSMYDVWISQYWNRYAPQQLKTAFRNVRYNVGNLIKKFKKIWRKHLWPILEPIFGVPKGTEKQKRQDAAEARKRMYREKGTRRKNTDFRDDEDEVHEEH